MMPKLIFPSLYCLRTSLCITLAIYAVVLFTQPYYPASEFFFFPLQSILSPSQTTPPPLDHNSPTNINHLVFGLVGSLKAWRHRKAYIESWWRPSVTRGYLYLDTAPTEELLPWSASSPPLRVSDDISKIVEESGHVAPIMVRMVHAILEVYREGDQGVRWYVMGDDDSIFFVDNWVDVLAKYDHTKYVYIGGHSETVMSNFYYSFDQGFGGAGFALSYPLASAMVKDLEGCIKRYPHFNSADFITKFCVDELGVSLSAERGIHQIDLKGDISGFLSSHPQSPLMSLHHFDMVDPIFPSMDRFQSVNHLMKSARVDQSRLLQQTICYHRPTNWSFSVSWGYSAHIYEKILPRGILKTPLETFEAWVQGASPSFMFNTRWPPFNNSCDAPHVFFLETVDNSVGNHIVSTYARSSSRGLSTCFSSGNHSAEHISKVRVLSPPTKLIQKQMWWNTLKECNEHLDEVDARCDNLQLRQARMFQHHQQPPADLIQNIHAALQQRAILRNEFGDLIPLVHFEKRHAIILVGGDVRDIYRAMHRFGEGGHFWYRVGRFVGTNVASIERNAQARTFPLAPPGHNFDWMLAGIDGQWEYS